MEVTPEDVIKQDEEEVNSTTDLEDTCSPVKKPKLQKKAQVARQISSGKQSTFTARMQAANSVLQRYFNQYPKLHQLITLILLLVS